MVLINALNVVNDNIRQTPFYRWYYYNYRVVLRVRKGAISRNQWRF